MPRSSAAHKMVHTSKFAQKLYDELHRRLWGSCPLPRVGGRKIRRQEPEQSSSQTLKVKLSPSNRRVSARDSQH